MVKGTTKYDEFALIQRLCQNIPTPTTSDSNLGPGDDSALLNVPEGQQLVVSTDTLNVDVHFFADADPYTIGHKSLAVNLSDLAAMGALPKWVTMNLSLPANMLERMTWLNNFSAGFGALAKSYGVELVGGDVTRGPLMITVTALGLVPNDQALLRSTAHEGDLIIVSGNLGTAAAALHLIQSGSKPSVSWLESLQQPEPRVDLGLALRGTANSMIDISDGLLADLKHILDASSLGAEIYTSQLPIKQGVREHHAFTWDWPLAGGDDYELCFTVANHHLHEIKDLSRLLGVPLTVIGEMTVKPELVCMDEQGQVIKTKKKGWNHFYE